MVLLCTHPTIEYLRGWYDPIPFFSIYLLHIMIYVLRLHLPSEIVPATDKKAVLPTLLLFVQEEVVVEEKVPTAHPRGGDRDGYRRKKEEGAPGEYRPRFAGVGRGIS